MFRRVAVISVVALLSGCSTLTGWLGEKEGQGYEFKGGEALEVPPDLSAAALERPSLDATRYSLFAQGQLDTQGDTKVLPKLEGVRVNRGAGIRWLEVDKPVNVVFTQVRDYLLSENYPLVAENPASGLIETDWVTADRKLPSTGIMSWFQAAANRDGNALIRDRYIIRFDYGDKPDTTEIYISHRAIERVVVRQGNRLLYEESQEDLWVPKQAEPIVEANMIAKMLIALGSDQILAQQVAEEAAAKKAGQTEDISRFITQNSQGIYQLEMPQGSYYDAWRLLSIALDRTGFTVEDRDRFDGKVYVLFDKSVEKLNEGEASFWDRFAFWKEDEEYDGQQVVITLDRNASPVTVSVLGDSDQAVTPALAKRVLEIINESIR